MCGRGTDVHQDSMHAIHGARRSGERYGREIELQIRSEVPVTIRYQSGPSAASSSCSSGRWLSVTFPGVLRVQRLVSGA